MFFASLFLAGLQLVGAAVVFAVARKQRAGGLILGFVGGFFAVFIVPSALMFFSAAAFFQAVALAFIGIVCVSILACPADRRLTLAAIVFQSNGSWEGGGHGDIRPHKRSSRR